MFVCLCVTPKCLQNNHPFMWVIEGFGGPWGVSQGYLWAFLSHPSVADPPPLSPISLCLFPDLAILEISSRLFRAVKSKIVLPNKKFDESLSLYQKSKNQKNQILWLFWLFDYLKYVRPISIIQRIKRIKSLIFLIFWLIKKLSIHPTSTKVNVKLTKMIWC